MSRLSDLPQRPYSLKRRRVETESPKLCSQLNANYEKRIARLERELLDQRTQTEAAIAEAEAMAALFNPGYRKSAKTEVEQKRELGEQLMSQLEWELREAQAELRATQTDLKTCRSELKDAVSTKYELQRQLKETNEKLESSQTDLKKCLASKSDAERMLLEAQNEVKSLQSELKEQKAASKVTKAHLQRKVIEANSASFQGIMARIVHTHCSRANNVFRSACENGFGVLVKVLVGQPKIDVNGVDADNRTPLHQASRKGHAEIVKYLVHHPKIDVNVTDWIGNTPIFLAARNGHTEVVKILVRQPGIMLNVKDRYYGDTPLHTACKRVNLETAMALWIPHTCILSYGEAISPFVNGINSLVTLLVSMLVELPDLTIRNDVGKTALDIVQSWTEQPQIERFVKFVASHPARGLSLT